jgi:flagellar L-ring protein precursor FlgH
MEHFMNQELTMCGNSQGRPTNSRGVRTRSPWSPGARKCGMGPARLTSGLLEWFAVGAMLFLATACTTTSNKTPVLPGPPAASMITPAAVPPPAPAPPQGASSGSLWTDNSPNFWRDVKAHRVGDIVTITVSEKAEASKKGSTKTGRSKDMSADFSFAGLTSGDKVLLDTVKSGYQGKFDTNFSGTGAATRSDSMATFMTATIVEVLPSNNFVIRGARWTKVNEEMQQIVLEGVIRPTDITRNNQVLSQNIADAKIFFSGKGPVSSQDKPGWLSRFFDAVNPF